MMKKQEIAEPYLMRQQTWENAKCTWLIADQINARTSVELDSDAAVGLKVLARMCKIPGELEAMPASEAVQAKHDGQCNHIYGDPAQLMAYCDRDAAFGRPYCEQHAIKATKCEYH